VSKGYYMMFLFQLIAGRFLKLPKHMEVIIIVHLVYLPVKMAVSIMNTHTFTR